MVRKDIIIAAVILVILIAAVVIIQMSGITITGHAYKTTKINGLYVSYYGVSNYPLQKASGKIQTLVKMDSNVINQIITGGKVIVTADAIMDIADFGNSMASMYKGEAQLPVPTSALDAVIAAGKQATGFFKSDTDCLRKTAEKFRNDNTAEFVIVTDIGYSQCKYYKDWLAGKIRHTYYTKGGAYLCQQQSSCVFSVEMGTGKTSQSCTGC